MNSFSEIVDKKYCIFTDLKFTLRPSINSSPFYHIQSKYILISFTIVTANNSLE